MKNFRKAAPKTFRGSFHVTRGKHWRTLVYNERHNEVILLKYLG